MNEERLQEVGRRLEEEIGASGRLRAAVAGQMAIGRARRSRMGVALGAAAVCVLAGVFTLAPQPARGAKVREMLGAMKGVTSMEVVTYVYRTTGRARVTESTHVGMIHRVVGHIGSKYERTWISRDGSVFQMDPFLHLTVREPSVAGEGDGQTPLEYSEEFTNLGMDGPRLSRIVPGPLHGGRETYRIIYDRVADHYHAEILVDKATNLPICDAIRDSVQSVDDEYRFNFAPDPKLFDPTGGGAYRVVDIEAESKEWAERWAKPIGEVSSDLGVTHVRDIQSSTDGAVFIVSSVKADWHEAALVPSELMDERGRRYLKVRDFAPGNTFADSWIAKQFRVDGEQAIFSVFVPTEPGPASHHFRLRFENRGDLIVPGSAAAKVSSSAEVGLEAGEPFEGLLPAYGTVMRLDDYHLAMYRQELEVRAIDCEKNGDDEGAARWYGELVVVAMKEHRTLAQRYVKKQADLLLRLGRKDEAKPLLKEMRDFALTAPNGSPYLVNMPIPF